MYRIRCPFCQDTRLRLHIHHRWGTGFPELGVDDRFWFAWRCWNEECQDDPANRKWLKDRVYQDLGRARRSNITVRPGNDEPKELLRRDFPGISYPLAQLPDRHPSREYLNGRGWDTQHLCELYNLHFCEHADGELRLATNRIVVPVYQHGEMVGWQARYVGDIDFKATRIPKYFTCPGMYTSACLYGYDQATTSPVAFLCEGVTDVWAVGPGAMALFGKRSLLDPKQAMLLAHHWKYLVILLDPDAAVEAEALCLSLRTAIPHIIKVQLPIGTDPAAINTDVLWDLIYGSAAAQGIDLADVCEAV
jgi:hypothetical protein